MKRETPVFTSYNCKSYIVYYKSLAEDRAGLNLQVAALQLNLSPFPILQSQRLILRLLTSEDEKEVYILRSDEQVNRYVNRPRAISIQDARNFIQKIKIGIAAREWIMWAITIKPFNKLAGTIVLWNIEPKEEKAEIGYELLPDYHGKGIMQEAMVIVLDYGFGIMKLKTIKAYTHVNNDASIRLLLKNNFEKKEPDEEMLQDPSLKDAVIYSLYATAKTGV